MSLSLMLYLSRRDGALWKVVMLQLRVTTFYPFMPSVFLYKRSLSESHIKEADFQT